MKLRQAEAFRMLKTNLEFVNLDAAAVTNGHQIISYKRRAGKPVFSSKLIEGPATATILTSHLKPGVYRFFCALKYAST